MNIQQLAEKMLRPGLLGLAGRVKENACKAELRRYFKSLGDAVLELNLQDADMTHAASVDNYVRLKIAPVIRRFNPILKSALEHHLTVAYKLADKMDYYVQEAEFQEWPDASGQDDHGRDKVNADGTGVIHDKNGKAYKVIASSRVYAGDPRPKVEYKVLDDNGNGIALAELRREKESVSALGVAPEHQRKGIATALYKHIELHLGYKLKPNAALTDEGKSFWKSREADDQGNGIDKLGPSGQTAADWASAHAGDLITAIDATTADDIAEAIAKGIEEMLGPDGTSRLLRQTVEDMTKRRADMIATTEMNRAMSEAALEKMQRIGVEYKQIILAEDACEICQSAADEDPIPVTQSYNTGDDGPPFHPNCRCAVTGARPPQED